MIALLDGLSIPLFSAGDRILALKPHQPDLLKWVRRESSQEDTERAVASANDTQREGQNHMEWVGLSGLSDPVPEDVKASEKAPKFKGVCISCPSFSLSNSLRLNEPARCGTR
jgi:hypothetical protein